MNEQPKRDDHRSVGEGSERQQAELNDRQAQEALDRDRNLLASVMRATDVMLVYLDPDFNFVWVNEAYAATCNFRPADMIGKNHFALYPDEENEAIFRQVRDTGEPVFHKDKPFLFPDQPERGLTYWDWSLVPTKGPDGKVHGLVFSLRETTRFKSAELALQESEERFRLFMENSPTVAWMKDEHGRLVYVSKAYADHFGVPEEELLGRTDADLWPEETATEFRRNDLAVLATDRPLELIEETHDPDGTCSYWLNHKFPFRNAAGRRFVGGIGLDITTLKRAEEELAAAKEAAERAKDIAESANEAKDRFMAIVSHELRTPLTPVSHAISLLQMDATVPDDLRKLLDVAERNLDLEHRLIDDLLDIAQITSGKLRLRRDSIDVAEVIRAAGRTLAPHLEGKLQTLGIHTPGAPYRAHADPARLKQVFCNLLSNSIKFSPPGSRIEVEARTVPHSESTGGESSWPTVEQDPPSGSLVVEINDQGSGIKPQMLPTLFDAFEQGEEGRSYGGLGLGLSISRAIVEMHGGAIDAVSEGVGHGTTLRVVLPLLS